jgi:hypothetical protein
MVGLATRQQFLETMQQVRHGYGVGKLADPLQDSIDIGIGMHIEQSLFGSADIIRAQS